MSAVFFIIFIILEITQLVLAFTKAPEKTAWLKTKAAVRLAETIALVGIIVVPSTHLKWRYAIALIVLVIRLLAAWRSSDRRQYRFGFGLNNNSTSADHIDHSRDQLTGRKKAACHKNRIHAVLSFVFSLVIVSLALAPAFIFTNYNGLPTTGGYDVKMTSAILVDESRRDTFENDGSYREVPVHFYYPDTDSGSYPLVVFSHGAFGYYQSNFSTYEELASNGYVVAALDHPHHAFFTKDTQGSIVTVDRTFINDVMNINNDAITEEWMKLRIADENFVLDTIETAQETGSLDNAWHTDNSSDVLNVLRMTNTDKIGLMGHSLGGATSTAVGRERSDIDAVIDLDGTMLSERISVTNGKYDYYDEPYPVPILDFTKEKDYNEREQYKNENAYSYVNDSVIENAKDGRTVVFSGALHMDFTDLPLISPTLASMLDEGESEVDNTEFMTTVNSIVLNWFNYYLKGEGTLDIQAKY